MMSSLFIGASGMRSLGEGMGVISNNLANLNTVGFKQSMMLYQDLISETVPATSNYHTGLSQAGMGVAPGSIRTLFTDGGWEASNTVTDMSINGIGYFGVQNSKGATFYTRAGNFRFTKEGDLVDPNGYTLLGHKITNGQEDGAVTPVRLDVTPGSAVHTIPAKATGSLGMVSNLGGVGATANDPANPFFALTNKWDGAQQSGLGSGDYSYCEPVSVYDSAGNRHTMTIYYNLAGESGGNKTYEYLVGIPPGESADSGSPQAGMLMSGTLSFTSQGQLQGMTAFNPDGTPAALVNGVPQFTANFAGSGAQAVTLDFGLKMNAGWNPAITNRADGGAVDVSAFYAATPGAQRSVNATTAFGDSKANRMSRQDGYATGYLSNLVIDPDGTVSGVYNNGQTQDLYRIGVYRFTSQDGLKHEGKNLFSATLESGPAQEGRAGDENFGVISSYMLEQSNVDMAREFAQMIVTQRGFQMNSKVVTTSDQMLQKALELKR